MAYKVKQKKEERQKNKKKDTVACLQIAVFFFIFPRHHFGYDKKQKSKKRRFDMENKKNRIEELVKELNAASYAYYNDLNEIMPNYEWDQKRDELEALEKETGYILDESPTQTVGAEEDFQSAGEKEEHEFPALSLAKDKDIAVIKAWAGDQPIHVSWKLDGSTLVATYDGGKLTKLLTRGNGLVGTNITHLAPYIEGVLMEIKDTGHFVVRGESVISYDDFDRINMTLDDKEDSYPNPRNLVSGTLGLGKDKAEKVKERGTQYIGFKLVYCEKEINSWGARMDYLKELGFKPVEHELTDANHLDEVVERWTKKVKDGEMNIPVDGLVITYDDVVYASGGSITRHHATREGIALKWPDEVKETMLLDIEWSCAANSITPVAIFNPVKLEGTTVQRASLCNISEMRRLGIGANNHTKLGVIKANMIIPKCISANANGTQFEIPSLCPVCGEKTEIRISGKTNTETLHCTNKDCTAKHLKKFERFVSREGLEIDGLSIKTISKFVNQGFIKTFSDIFSIWEHQDEIIEMEGFGEKSYNNLIKSINDVKDKLNYTKFIYSLCIPMIGQDAAKRIINAIGSQAFKERLENKTSFDDIDGIGTEKSNSILLWYEENREEFLNLCKILKLDRKEEKKKEANTDGTCSGLVFVITGKTHIFTNRKDFTRYVEDQGGKVAGSVSGKTNYLVNNDSLSESNKNKEAKANGVQIITEDEFVQMFGE